MTGGSNPPASAGETWCGRSTRSWQLGARTFSSTQLDHVTHHARVLVDIRGSETPFGALRAHALIVRNGLTSFATERSLTLAVWFDDALGPWADPGQPVSIDPVEDA